ncbi:DUF1624 domain-containing protein [Aurantibacillus circumpalustris]|uniref:DUF1624 domain-containing protein n=1 Tax=Aurantibacillus circumpalustris TaxID=3036359 RepID=UPI00295BC7D4|nr:heparan-alpha-glucosaminide N-acetyltransferase domain-containing protein [Aurantibacillus circumpalustris]
MEKPNLNSRIISIDFMRGLVIAIMAIDHIRDLLHTTALINDPLDLNTSSPALFMTRWITHICAPVFVFLAGTSAYLTLINQNHLAKTKQFLRSRGLLLMFLEITVVGFGVWFDIYFRTFLFQVIFAIGAGFLILSFLLKIHAKYLGVLGVCILIFHNLTPLVHIDKGTALGFVWSLLFDRGFFKLGDDRALMIGYAIVPWLGILLCGFSFGKVFSLSNEKRSRILVLLALISLFTFILLRSFNLYGDQNPWSVQSTFINSFFSFINLTKYPPSLLYACATLSIMFFIMWLADNKNNRFMRIFVVYGRVPMFFYILHWYIIHISMFVMIRIQGVEWKDMPFGIMQFGRPDSGVGLHLPYIYIYWICLIILMYPLCNWYGNYKAKNRQIRWLKYF